MREIAEGEELPAPIRVEDKSTKPPARYTESTLLAAMEGAGKLIDDDELREAMSERGLAHPLLEPRRLKVYSARNTSLAKVVISTSPAKVCA